MAEAAETGHFRYTLLARAPWLEFRKIRRRKGSRMKVLVIDVGGTHVKVLVTGEDTPRTFDSGPNLTPGELVKRIKEITKDWRYEAISMGYPGPVMRNRPVAEPHNLGRGWVGFPFERSFGRPVKMLNDAAM